MLDGESQSVTHKTIGEIVIEAGSTGKSGSGIKHIIEQRLADGKSINEVVSLLTLVVDVAKDGEVNGENAKNIELEENGVVAIIAKEKFGDSEKWLLTGFDDWSTDDSKQKATDAIQTVTAQYGYTPSFSQFRSKVVAVKESIQQAQKLSSEMQKDIEKIRDKKFIANYLDAYNEKKQKLENCTQPVLKRELGRAQKYLTECRKFRYYDKTDKYIVEALGAVRCCKDLLEKAKPLSTEDFKDNKTLEALTKKELAEICFNKKVDLGILNPFV